MSLFESLQNTSNNQQNALAQLKANPQSVLAQADLNIPNGMTNPNQIINHLLQSGQVSNPRLQMAQRMMGMMRR